MSIEVITHVHMSFDDGSTAGPGETVELPDNEAWDLLLGGYVHQATYKDTEEAQLLEDATLQDDSEGEQPEENTTKKEE